MLQKFLVFGQSTREMLYSISVSDFHKGNPLEEKHSLEGTWRAEATRRLPNLKKLDGIQLFLLTFLSCILQTSLNGLVLIFSSQGVTIVKQEDEEEEEEA